MQIIEDGYGGNNDPKEGYISNKMLLHWIGSDHINVYELLELLNDLVNEKYSIKEFQTEVLTLWEDTV